jgi:hypothetical protein
VTEHEVQLPDATSFITVDEHLIPTGTFTEVG